MDTGASVSLVSNELFQKIAQATGRSLLFQPGAVLWSISGKLVNVLGKTQIATPELGIVTYCVVHEVAHECVIG